MAILPRYQRIGLKTRQPQQMDFAAAREQARLGQNLSQQLDRMSDFAFKQAAAEAETRGQEAVREEGALPTLTALREAGGPTNIEERAAFDAANRIAVVEIESLAKQDYQNLVREADKDDMPMSVFQESIADIQNGYAASLQEIDPVAAGVLSARLSDSAMTYQGRYSDIATRKATVAASERVKEITEVGVKEIIDMALSETFNETNIEIAAGKFVNDLIALGVKEKNAQKVADSALSKAVRENRIYTYDNADSIATKKSLLELYEKRPLPGATYEQNRSFNGQLQNNLNVEINRAQQAAQTNLIEAIDAMTLTGTAPSGFEIDEENIKSIFSPEAAEQYLKSWEQASEDAANRGALAYMNSGKVEQITLDLEEESRKAEASGNSKDIYNTQIREASWKETVNKRNDAIDKDAAAFVVGTSEAAAGIVENIVRQLQREDINGASEGLILLKNIMDTRFDELDLPSNLRNVMPKQMAAQISGLVQSVAPDIAIATFAQIQTNLGDYAARFVEELRMQNLSPEFVQALYVQSQPVQKELVEISTIKEKEITASLLNTTPNDVNKEIITALTDSNYREAFLAGGSGPALKIYNQQVAVAKKLVLSRLSLGSESEDNIAQAVENVLNDLIPEYSQSVDDKYGLYVVPMSVSPENVSLSINSLMSQDTLKLLNVEPLPSDTIPDYILEAVTIASLSSTGKWLNNSTADGLTLHYDIGGYFLESNLSVKFVDLPDLVKSLYTEKGLSEEARGWLTEGQSFAEGSK